MKTKIIAAAVALLAGFSQAATLNWGVDMNSLLYVTEDGVNVSMANNYSGDTDGWKFCLVYLGASGTLNPTTTTLSDVVDSFDYAVYPDGDDAYLDVFTSTFNTTGTATALDGTSLTISAGDSFGILFFNGTDYSYIRAVEGGTIGDEFTSKATLSNLSATANTVNHFIETSGIAVSATSVPEPSVAIMGLLGLGMLLKRRRA